MVAIKKVLNSSSNVGIITLDTYCFVSYFGVESDLLLSFVVCAQSQQEEDREVSSQGLPPVAGFFHPIFYHLFIISKQKNLSCFRSVWLFSI